MRRLNSCYAISRFRYPILNSNSIAAWFSDNSHYNAFDMLKLFQTIIIYPAINEYRYRIKRAFELPRIIKRLHSSTINIYIYPRNFKIV